MKAARIEFHDAVFHDVESAASWYEEKAGLGRDFIERFDEVGSLASR